MLYAKGEHQLPTITGLVRVDELFMSEHIDERESVVGLFELIASNSCSAWFTEQELAVSQRLVNKDGKTLTGGIENGPHANRKIILYGERYVGVLRKCYRPDAIRLTDEETKHHPLRPRTQKYGREGIQTH